MHIEMFSQIKTCKTEYKHSLYHTNDSFIHKKYHNRFYEGDNVNLRIQVPLSLDA